MDRHCAGDSISYLRAVLTTKDVGKERLGLDIATASLAAKGDIRVFQATRQVHPPITLSKQPINNP